MKGIPEICVICPRAQCVEQLIRIRAFDALSANPGQTADEYAQSVLTDEGIIGCTGPVGQRLKAGGVNWICGTDSRYAEGTMYLEVTGQIHATRSTPERKTIDISDFIIGIMNKPTGVHRGRGPQPTEW
jgi:hypothetical protein